ncbi:hypothetical protein LTR74_016906 [Friedmanniomyces endolithicus]|nr:hypothetical protein LTR74_016906 [Friedmanniomyces endolithicus]
MASVDLTAGSHAGLQAIDSAPTPRKLEPREAMKVRLDRETRRILAQRGESIRDGSRRKRVPPYVIDLERLLQVYVHGECTVVYQQIFGPNGSGLAEPRTVATNECSSR